MLALASNHASIRRHRGAATMLLALLCAGCATFETVPPQATPPPPAPPAVAVPPLATHLFEFDPRRDTVVGELQVTIARHEDTLSDLARRFNLGLEEIKRANPGVDQWLPGEGTRILLPTQFVLPEASYEGIVVNVAALRMFHFPKPRAGEPQVVITYPIGIGKVGWETPTGQTTIVSKRAEPWWTPPESVRREHAEAGDPLPARVPPGPDNPLGRHAMNLGWPSYLMHGTNKPAGVGLRASHGCIRLYPEDIASLFDTVAVGTAVRVVNQPLLYRWHRDGLYVQAYPPLEEHAAKDAAAPGAAKQRVLNDMVSDRMWQQARQHTVAVDWPLTERVLDAAAGIAVPVTRRGLSLQGFIDSARLVDNTLPAGSNRDDESQDGAGVATRAAVAETP